MAKDRIKSEDVIDPKLKQNISDVNKELAKSIELMTKATQAAIDMKKAISPKNIQEVTASQKESNKVRKESIEANKKYTNTIEKQKKAEKELTVENERTKLALQKRRKEIRDNIKAEKAESNSINDLSRKNKILRERIKNVSTETERGRKRILAYNKAIDRNSQKITNASDAMTRQKIGIGKYSTALKGLTSALGIVTGGFAIAAAAIRKGIQVTKEAIEVNRTFEKTFANVLTLLTKAEKKEFGLRLEKGAVDILARYGISIEDTNEALFDTISNGIELGDAIIFLDKAARLAIAGNAELADVVKGSTKVYEIYKDEVENVDEVLNAFFAAQVEGATTVGLLANNIGKVAATAKKAGVPISELFGVLAGLTKFLDGTEEAATALVNVINSVIKVTPAAEREFKKLGIETGITAIKQNGLLKTILQIVDATKENEDVITKLIPNIRAFKGLAGLTAESIAELEANILKLSDTELSSIQVQEAFNEQMATAQKQADVLKGSYRRMLIVIGGGESIFKKIGTSIRTGLTETFDEISNNIEVFRVTWTADLTLMQLAWDRITRQLTKGEFRDAVKKNKEEAEKSLLDIAERYDLVKRKIDENTVSIDENTETKKENIKVTEEFNKAEIKAAKEQLDKRDRQLEFEISQDIAATKRLEKLEKKKKDILDKAEQEKIDRRDRELEFEIAQDIRLTDAEDESREKRKEKEEKDNEERKQEIQDYTDFAINLAHRLSNNILGFLDNQITAQRDADIQKALSRGASEAEITKIEEKAAKKRKDIALADAIINTALAVTRALVTADTWIEGLIAGVLVAAEGALQIIAIESASFAKGTADSGQQWLKATLAEKGTEQIILADGTSFLTPNSQMQMYLPPHSEVIPNRILQQDLAEMQAMNKPSKSRENEQRRKEEHRELIRAIKNRDETNINITEGGFAVTAKIGMDRIKYIDRNYRS